MAQDKLLPQANNVVRNVHQVFYRQTCSWESKREYLKTQWEIMETDELDGAQQKKRKE